MLRNLDDVKYKTRNTQIPAVPGGISLAYHHGDLKRALLDEAAKLLRNKGEDALSMRKLASTIGVSRTASYYHFADKNALLCGIAEEGFRLFEEQVSQGATRDEEFGREAQLDYVRRYIGFACDNPEYYDLMFGGRIWKSKNATEALSKVTKNCFRSHVERLRRWQKQGLVAKEVDAVHHSQVAWSVMHGLSRFLIDGLYVDKRALEPACKKAADMIWNDLVRSSGAGDNTIEADR